MTESTLRQELANLPTSLRKRLDASGFDPERLLALAAPLFARARGEATIDRDDRNRVEGMCRICPPPGPASTAASLPWASGRLDEASSPSASWREEWRRAWEAS